jgi:GT2 family glycosyltransferase
MIPCLGVLVLNRGDLLLRMVNSIDYPVERLCIVQNGCSADVEDAIAEIKGGRNSNVHSVYVARPFKNMGVCPAWNLIIKSWPECDYWLIANNDTLFLPGDLEKYHSLAAEHARRMVLTSGSNWSCFTITPQVVAECGLFDENIWPIYHEDVDYFVRCKLVGIELVSLPSDLGESYNGSWTVRSNSNYHSSNSVTQAKNGEYVAGKWGQQCEHAAPWQDHSRDLRDWYYDPYRRRTHSEAWQHFEDTANRIR